jgi:hypothetical protein
MEGAEEVEGFGEAQFGVTRCLPAFCARLMSF